MGNDQYVEVTGEFARFLDDPYIDGRIERDPVTDETDVVAMTIEIAAVSVR